MRTSLSATEEQSCGEHSEVQPQLILLPAGLAEGSPGPVPQDPLQLLHKVNRQREGRHCPLQ